MTTTWNEVYSIINCVFCFYGVGGRVVCEFPLNQNCSFYTFVLNLEIKLEYSKCTFNSTVIDCSMFAATAKKKAW